MADDNELIQLLNDPEFKSYTAPEKAQDIFKLAGILADRHGLTDPIQRSTLKSSMLDAALSRSILPTLAPEDQFQVRRSIAPVLYNDPDIGALLPPDREPIVRGILFDEGNALARFAQNAMKAAHYAIEPPDYIGLPGNPAMQIEPGKAPRALADMLYGPAPQRPPQDRPPLVELPQGLPPALLDLLNAPPVQEPTEPTISAAPETIMRAPTLADQAVFHEVPPEDYAVGARSATQSPEVLPEDYIPGPSTPPVSRETFEAGVRLINPGRMDYVLAALAAGNEALAPAVAALRIPLTTAAETVARGLRPLRAVLPSAEARRLAGVMGSRLFSPILKEGIVRRLGNGFVGWLEGHAGSLEADQATRVSEMIAQSIEKGALARNPELKAWLRERGMTRKDLADDFRWMASTSGRNLGIISDAKRLMLAQAAHNPEIARLLAKLERQDSPLDTLYRWYLNTRNALRAGAVGQIDTATRNHWGQAGRASLNFFSDLAAGVARYPRHGVMSFADAYEDALALLRYMNPADRAKLAEVLDAYPKLVKDLRGREAADTMLGPYMKYVGVFTNMQEFFHRDMAFQARLRANLLRRGLNLDTVNMRAIPKQDITDALDHALRMTFAQTPSTRAGRAILGSYLGVPLLTELVNPFPRFWGNAVKFLVDFNPILGPTKLYLKPEIRYALLHGDTLAAQRAIGDAFTGLHMFAGALTLRSSPQWAGPKWYLIKDPRKPGQFLDLRPFAPFTQYLFMAEALLDSQRPVHRLQGTDYIEGALAINRIAGSSLWLFRQLGGGEGTTGTSPERTATGLAELTGEIASRITVPLKSFSDILSAMDQREAVIRSKREVPALRNYFASSAPLEALVAPALSNVPIAGRKYLPPLPKAVGDEQLTRENPIERLFTGVQTQVMSPADIEMARLGKSPTEVLPKPTGSRQMDRLLTLATGGPVEHVMNQVIKSDFYQHVASDRSRAVILLHFAKMARAKVATDARVYMGLGAEDRGNFLAALPTIEQQAMHRLDAELRPGMLWTAAGQSPSGALRRDLMKFLEREYAEQEPPQEEP